MRRLRRLVLGVGLAGVVGCGRAGLPTPPTTRLHYHSLPALPPQQGQANPGVAGAFAGVSHGALLVAGGANFPNGYPWQNGPKVWHATVYVLTGKGSRQRWQLAQPLAQPLAYGASVGWHNQLIGLGGNNADRRHSQVFTLTWDADAGQVQQGTLPNLPLALANHAAAVLGDVLYVFGGESDHGTEKSLYALNLRHPATGWQRRADLPGPARAFTALAALGEALYVLGGRETVAGTTTVFKDAYRYEPAQDHWAALPDMPVALAAHGAAAAGPHALLIPGGDDGVRLQQIEALNRQLATTPAGPAHNDLLQRRNALQAVHPGFRREVWEFRPGSRRWAVVDTLPYPAPVTTPVVRRGRQLLLPSGEISPGVRTPAIRQLTVK
ncbi:galactose oxidase (plasmid) [Hymenobacter sp. NBH84]|uniref:Kelch repeat-containing protein n=1 Tax=Hymenobacter sp. NBH84 TaxID=2596915 RepID=UPI0016255D69|nr:galactose oxidase [Hymenobacter sp. NBH84]QNE41941.1 galactose oxidase [Hymenobacter sp. NBH84]